MQTARIGSLRLKVAGLEEALNLVRTEAPQPGRYGICLGYLNPHVYNVGVHHRSVAAFLERCAAVCLDGVGAAVTGSLLNGTHLPRVVMHHVFDACVQAGLLRGHILLLGLTPEDNARAAARLRQAAPAAQSISAYHGFLGDADYAAVLREHADVDVVLAGMGSPRSETILLQASEQCTRALCWHVGGGSLRHWAGSKQRAPRWLSHMGFEWLHRMAHEPQTRTRYSEGIPTFLRQLAVDHLQYRRDRRNGAPP